MAWERQKVGELAYLTIPKWSLHGVTAVFSTRGGGVGSPPYSSLNMALHVGDMIEDVLHNRRVFLAGIGRSPEDCVAAEQVHGTAVRFVTETDRGRGMQNLVSALPSCDGMLTAQDVGLLSFFADCVPVFFFHPRSRIIGLAHAGWRGTAGNIVQEMVNRIIQAGADAEECLAAVGPCIGPCCYDIGDSVASIFREKWNEPSVLSETASGEYSLDLQEANRQLLISAGIRAENILIAQMCTSCHPGEFFSYRREGITGRMAAYIGFS
jgi:hypothetical protein